MRKLDGERQMGGEKGVSDQRSSSIPKFTFQLQIIKQTVRQSRTKNETERREKQRSEMMMMMMMMMMTRETHLVCSHDIKELEEGFPLISAAIGEKSTGTTHAKQSVRKKHRLKGKNVREKKWRRRD